MSVPLPSRIVMNMQSVPIWMVVIIALVNLDLLVMENRVQVHNIKGFFCLPLKLHNQGNMNPIEYNYPTSHPQIQICKQSEKGHYQVVI